jgi:ribonuclease HII
MALHLSYDSGILEAGVDEAGRGCLAGPVVAAAVILPHDYKDPGLNDSKKLSATQRNQLRASILESAIAWNAGIISAGRIDEINILNATFEAMHEALQGLSLQPELLLIDGNRFKPFANITHHCITGGDGKYASIAAASILAKTLRDEIMQHLHMQYPQYGWNTNKGYGTKAHVQAIHALGRTPFHRKSFQVPAQLKLF